MMITIVFKQPYIIDLFILIRINVTYSVDNSENLLFYPQN
jgi:hypothetical protein